jgi:ABC-2 type transport system ATP-binding protein
MSAIVLERLERRFGDLVALKDVSFEIEVGEVVALLGPNGAGKTTTFEILEGYLAPTAGHLLVLGEDPRRAGRAWRARIGVVLQSTSLDLQLTVRDSLALYSRLFPDPMPIPELLELIGLESDAQTRIGHLSGGQRRRVDLALGIIGRPELLFLDEPTTGLDPEARRHSWAIIKQLAAQGATVLLSTHHMEEAQQLARRLLVLAGGQLIADSTAGHLRARAARTRIHLPVPGERDLGDLPNTLARHVAGGQLELLVASTDLPTVITELLDWARANDVSLAGLEVSPPTLEDTYLHLTQHQHRTHTPSHV